MLRALCNLIRDFIADWLQQREFRRRPPGVVVSEWKKWIAEDWEDSQ